MIVINFTCFVFDPREYAKEYRQKMTTIAISNENYLLLKSKGDAGDSFNDVLTKLLKLEQSEK